MVLTEDTAKKYFGDEDPIGKILKVDNQFDYTVTGVVENIPKNSHFTFDILCSFESLYAQNREAMEVWLSFNLYTYVLLQENFDPKVLENKFPALIDKHMGTTLKAIGGEINFFLQPLTKIHLHSHMENEIGANSDIAYIYIFAAIALFILIIACINFMNLATARSALRAREVGIRKVVGAERKELIRQFLGESLIYSLFSMLIAIGLAHLVLPVFSSLSGRDLSIDYLGMPWLIPGLFAMLLFVGFAAGSYPALFLSSFQPEIGIRKVLGASVSGVVVLLAKDFLKLVLLANIIAWPIAYFAMNKWTQGFSYQARIGVWMFVITGVLAAVIALLTVSFQSIKAALSHPINAIKYE